MRPASEFRRWLMVVLIGTLVGFVPGLAGALSTATNDGYWDGAIWDSVPTAGDDVLIPAPRTVTLTNSTLSQGIVTITGKLVFQGWQTKLIATNVIINGTVTNLPQTASVTNSSGGWDPDNRVYIVCTNLTVNPGGAINANGAGYTNSATSDGYGPGGGIQTSGGGSYGGPGGGRTATRGLVYGAAGAPEDPGSAGGSNPAPGYPGGKGGGAVRVDASGTVTVNGTISANGGKNTSGYAGSGSGGGIYINCVTLAGNGLISANGADGASIYSTGGGGGGRIAIYYSSASGASVTCTVARGTGPGSSGDIGTIYVSDYSLLSQPVVSHVGQWISLSSICSLASLTVSNGWVRFLADGFQLNVGGNLTLTGSGKLEVGGSSVLHPMYVPGPSPYDYTNPLPFYHMTTPPIVTVAQDLVLTNGGCLYLFSAMTNTPGSYGTLLDVTGNVSIGASSWLFPYSHATNGGAPRLQMQNLTILEGGGIDATNGGYMWRPTASATGYGPGGGGNNSPGGYGGLGATALGGGTYGDPAAPIQPGSSAGSYPTMTVRPGMGGGTIWVRASGTVAVNGTIMANGRDGDPGWTSGGAGGGIYIECQKVTGSGLVSANGGSFGSNPSGGGGGGRIAILYNQVAQDTVAPTPPIVFSVRGGVRAASSSSLYGDVGTLYFLDSRFLDAAATNYTHAGQWLWAGMTGWTAPSYLWISNAWLRFMNDGFQVTVPSDMTLTSTGRFDLCGTDAKYPLNYYQMTNVPRLSVGGNLLLTNGSTFSVFSALTNATAGASGAVVTVTGDLIITTNCWIYVYAHTTNGGAPIFGVNNLTIRAGGGISADGKGYMGKASTAYHGPGGGGAYSGGGYGGMGGSARGGTGGGTYGDSNAPVNSGSAGGYYDANQRGSCGGGVVRIDATVALTLEGTITANGEARNYVGGGAGGSIYLKCKRFLGANGSLSAKGGNEIPDGSYGIAGGGGGGRIAVWRMYDRYQGAVATNVSGGLGYNLLVQTPAYDGSNGTVVFGLLPIPYGTVFVVH